MLEVSRMDDPLELDTLSEACPNLQVKSDNLVIFPNMDLGIRTWSWA